MTVFRHVTTSTPRKDSPANSVGWLNAVTDAAAFFHGQQAAGSSSGVPGGRAIDPCRGKARNDTGMDLLRGHVVHLSDKLLDAVDPRRLWFVAALPTTDAMDNIAVVRKSILQGEIGQVQTLGVCTALVDVTDVDHTHAAPQAGSAVAISANEGPLRIVPALTTTGEQELEVVLGAGGGGGGAVNYWRGIITYENKLTAATFQLGGDGPLGDEVPRTLTPGFGQVYRVYPDPETIDPGPLDPMLISSEPELVLNWYSKEIEVTQPDRALVGHFLNSELVNIDCEEILWAPFPAEPPA